MAIFQNFTPKGFSATIFNTEAGHHQISKGTHHTSACSDQRKRNLASLTNTNASYFILVTYSPYYSMFIFS